MLLPRLAVAGLCVANAVAHSNGATPLDLESPQAHLGTAPLPHGAAGDDALREERILEVLREADDDPVAALARLRPELARDLARPRLLHVMGEDEPRWRTEGDKLRLRRQRKKFADVTDYQDLYDELAGVEIAGEPNLPALRHQRLVKPLFQRISVTRMTSLLQTLTSFYNRYFGDVPGEQSAQWIHDYIAQIISESPFRTHISLEYFPHPFPQPSLIARFEPKVRNASLPLTILGAHQDSANYLFPLLRAPGADDDGSGTVSILEAFRVLALSGFTPRHGPVEFHWYAAEEGGLLGSQAIARYKKDQGARIGAMMEFDMTGFVARNATENIGFVVSQADEALTNWTVHLAQEYVSLPVGVYELPPYAGSDYMSFTKLKYPSAFASEGDPYREFDPYVHGVGDTMDVDDETGYFSVEHMARFTELAIAFAVEQAGWDNTWR